MAKDVEIFQRTPLYKGFFRIDLYRFRHKLPDGEWSPIIEREVFDRGRNVGILLYDPQADLLVLIQEMRITAHLLGRDGWLVDIAAGGVEPGETLEDAARREAFEETGCEVEDLVEAQTYLPSPGNVAELVTLFCGKVDASKAGPVGGAPAKDESIRVHVVSAEAALTMLESGEVSSAAGMLALSWFFRHRDRLRKKWTPDIADSQAKPARKGFLAGLRGLLR